MDNLDAQILNSYPFLAEHDPAQSAAWYHAVSTKLIDGPSLTPGAPDA